MKRQTGQLQLKIFSGHVPPPISSPGSVLLCSLLLVLSSPLSPSGLVLPLPPSGPVPSPSLFLKKNSSLKRMYNETRNTLE